MEEHRAARRLLKALEVRHPVDAVIGNDRERFPEIELVVQKEAVVVLEPIVIEVAPLDVLVAIFEADPEIVPDHLVDGELRLVDRLAVEDVLLDA